MTDNKYQKLKKLGFGLLLTLCVINVLWWVFSMLIDPSKRVGPFGLGLPSTMTDLMLEQDGLKIAYPESWNAFLTPHGNHGDMEVISIIYAPFRSLPSVTIARKPFSEDNISLVASWGETRAQMQDTEYQSISISPSELGQFSGLLREYIVGMEIFGKLSETHCEDLYILYNQMGYAFSFCADPDDWPEVKDTFNEMIASIAPAE